MWKLKQRLRNHCHFSKALALKDEGEFADVWRHLLLLWLGNKREKHYFQFYGTTMRLSSVCAIVRPNLYKPREFQRLLFIAHCKEEKTAFFLRKANVCSIQDIVRD